jgi:5-methylcytosine-specific restriction endonuclease McrA
MPSSNPRYANPKKRNGIRRLMALEEAPCAICGKPIDYTLTTYVDPKDGKTKRHPLSFEVDEIIPISKGGSPTDRANLQAVHRICNQRKGNKIKVNDGRVNTENKSLVWSRAW